MTTKTAYMFNEPQHSNFDVSVVMPFYKKLKEFAQIFPRNRKYFERNGIEIVLVLDCPDEKDELLDFIKRYPLVNWRVIWNDKPHEWRNPSIPLNVGLKYATKKYLMVCSPESEFLTDAVLQLREALENYPDHFAIGTVCFADDEDIITPANAKDFDFKPFGSIMVEKTHLFHIRGYDETLNKWGGDDNNIRARLEMIDVAELFLPEVMLIHRDFNNEEGKTRRSYIPKEVPTDASRHFFFPKKALANNDSWGEDFNTIIYDWKNNVYAPELLNHYLSRFDKSSINADSFGKEYELLLLVQSYNEEENIRQFLEDMALLFDGIILLDDGSEDNTYEKTKGEKLLLKVKKGREVFDDLLNRNLLLDLASFFSYKWACFIDLDEVFDARFADIRNLIKEHRYADSFIFNLIQLWDDDNKYNAEYPSSVNGISLKFRMFKNIGRTQIYSGKGKLHFHPIPYIGKAHHAPILIKHYGNLTKQMREDKFNFYKKEDIEQCQASYEHLLTETPLLKDICTLTVNDLASAVKLLT